MERRFIRTIEDLAVVVREQRDRRGWTQQELAEWAGVDHGFVELLEEGHQHASLADVLAVLRELDVEPLALPDTAPVLDIHAVDLDAFIETFR